MKKTNHKEVIKVCVLLFLTFKINAQQSLISKDNIVFDDKFSSSKMTNKLKEVNKTKAFIINDNKQNINLDSQHLNNSLKTNSITQRPKVALPFYVYKEGEKPPYIPSGLMGNYKKLKVETKSTESVYAGDYSMKISYNSNHDWYGVAVVNPVNDWGDIDGGYDISGAKMYSFWARASEKGVKATIGFGMVGKDKKFPDSAKVSKDIKFSTKWKKYVFKLDKLNLSRIRTGFLLFSGGIGKHYEIFIDNIVFE